MAVQDTRQFRGHKRSALSSGSVFRSVGPCLRPAAAGGHVTGQRPCDRCSNVPVFGVRSHRPNAALPGDGPPPQGLKGTMGTSAFGREAGAFASHALAARHPERRGNGQGTALELTDLGVTGRQRPREPRGPRSRAQWQVAGCVCAEVPGGLRKPRVSAPLGTCRSVLMSQVGHGSHAAACARLSGCLSLRPAHVSPGGAQPAALNGTGTH